MADVCIITGGSRGIGAACVRLAAQSGYTVVFSYVANRQAADELVSEIAASGGKAVAIKSDVASRSDCDALFAEAVKHGTIRALINNAGIVGTTARLDEMTDERMERIMQVNIMGTLYCSQLAVKAMSSRHGGKGGNIVNLSSAAAVLGSPSTYIDYAASKGAIDTFTIGLAREVATEGIRVNGVRPGIIDTDIHASGGEPDRVAQMRDAVPMKREGSAEEVANAIVWLMSDAASYVTGTTIDVTGGR
jgi:NAD(P)-dependent dehydrogenase (short-subunit alcohol dehydrogenase family)